jgi:hypothetical protein
MTNQYFFDAETQRHRETQTHFCIVFLSVSVSLRQIEILY